MTRLDDKKLKKLEKAVVTDLFHNGLTRGKLRTRYDISERQYRRILELALYSGKITPEQNKERILQARRHNSKIDKEIVRDIAHDVFDNHMSRVEICNKYDISNSVFTRAMRLSVSYEFISQEQYSRYISEAPARAVEARNKKYTHEEISEMARQAWAKGIGSNPNALRTAGAAGGKITASKFKEGSQPPNLKNNSKPYMKNLCYYGEIEFHSEGERFTGMLLVELGLLPELTSGENFHRHLNGKEVDFYVNDKLVIEYHRQIKKHSGIESLTEEEYIRQRLAQLKGNFDGEIISIANYKTASEYYEKLGLEFDMTFMDFMEKYRAVRQKLEEYDREIKEMEKFFEDKAAPAESSPAQEEEPPF
jgi:hypothetical protein